MTIRYSPKPPCWRKRPLVPKTEGTSGRPNHSEPDLWQMTKRKVVCTSHRSFAVVYHFKLYTTVTTELGFMRMALSRS